MRVEFFLFFVDDEGFSEGRAAGVWMHFFLDQIFFGAEEVECGGRAKGGNESSLS